MAGNGADVYSCDFTFSVLRKRGWDIVSLGFSGSHRTAFVCEVSSSFLSHRGNVHRMGGLDSGRCLWETLFISLVRQSSNAAKGPAAQ